MYCECGWDTKPWNVADLGKRTMERIIKFELPH